MFLASGESERLSSKSANVFDEEGGQSFLVFRGTTERRGGGKGGGGGGGGSKAAFRVPDKRGLWPRVKKLGGIEGRRRQRREEREREREAAATGTSGQRGRKGGSEGGS